MSEIASSIHENGIVLLHIPSGQMFASNVIGARIWCGLREGQCMEMIVSDISNDYQVDSTTTRGHVEAFVNELERQKLIHREMPS
jgi:Coenzyme PQQ synthesis protein D (PqqD)